MNEIYSTGFKIFLFLHIAAVIVAFAPSVLAVLPGRREGLLGTLDDVGRKVYAPALILAGLFGIACILTSDVNGTALIEFSDTWISLAFVVWIAMNGVFHALVLAGQRNDDAAKVTTGHQIMTVLLVAMLYLMVFQPGS